MEAAGRWMFEEAREGGELTDMEFVFDTGRRIRGHKLWLIARSEYFRAMLSSGMREGSTGVMHVRECGEGAFLALLEFLYTGRLGDTCLKQEWWELWELSDLFGVEGMDVRLLDAVSLSNIEEAAQVAMDKDITELMETCATVLIRRGTPRPFQGAPMSRDEARCVVRSVHMLSKRDHDVMFSEGCIRAQAVTVSVLLAMTSYKHDAFVQEEGSICLGLAIDRDLIGGLGAEVMIAVLDAMKLHQANAAIQEQGCTILGNLSRGHHDSSAWGGINGLEAIEVIVRALKANTGNPRIQEQGCRAIALAMLITSGCGSRALLSVGTPVSQPGDITNRISAEEAGAIRAVVQALHSHKTDARLQCQGCSALSGLCQFQQKNRVHTGEESGLEAIVEALNVHAGDPDVQREGCRALAQVCFGNFENQLRAVKAGSLEAVTAALAAHKTERRVQEEGRRALSVTAAGVVQELKDLRFSRLSNPVAVQKVVDTLIACQLDAQVQLEGCRTLGILCAGTGARQQNQTHAGAAGGFEAVVRALSSHMYNAGVQEEACGALRNLCYEHDNNRRHCGEAGGVEAVVHALERALKDSTGNRLNPKSGLQASVGFVFQGPLSDARVQVCCGALRNICSRNPENVRRAEAAGGLEAIVHALATHPGSFDVQEQVCAAMQNLCRDNDENRRRVGQAGGVEAIIKCLESSILTWGNESTQGKCCGALGDLCVVDENRPRAGEAGGVKIIVQVLRSVQAPAMMPRLSCSGLHGAVQVHASEECCRALGNLCFNHDKNQYRVRKAKGVGAVVEALKLNIKSAAVALTASWALSNICSNVENCGIAQRLGAVTLMEAVISGHPRDASVQLHAKASLAILTKRVSPEPRAPIGTPSVSPWQWSLFKTNSKSGSSVAATRSTTDKFQW
jgi:hypothetical protein